MSTFTIPALKDSEMACEITQASEGDKEILIVANGLSVLLAVRSCPTHPWIAVAEGEFDNEALEASRARIKENVFWWIATTEDLQDVDLTQVSPEAVKVRFIRSWIKKSGELSGIGRGGEASEKNKELLGYEAGWRCQFSGCGKDLRRHSVSGSANKSSYFAHIIASSPDGPRGHPILSHKLAKDISNYLVLCDECHRRIDRVDQRRFSVDVLRKMRETNINEVSRLLSTLQYREAIPIVLMGKVFDQAPHFDRREAEEGMWTRRLRMRPGHPHHFMDNGWSTHDPHKPTYWIQFLERLNAEKPELHKLIQTSQPNPGNFHLAVFVLHGTSVQILAGRLFGEGCSLSIFQYRRSRLEMVPDSHWVFDDTSLADPDKYVCRELNLVSSNEKEAILLVSLTFNIEHHRLPAELYADGELQLKALEITTAEAAPNHDIIANEADLNALSQVMEQAVKTLQDSWRVSKVHLVVGAPSSVCFKLGQKMQAGHHAIYRCYESTGGQNAPFAPTIEISHDEVNAIYADAKLSLR